MMAARIQGTGAIEVALAYANKQIDQFAARGKLTFSELAVIVEAVQAMSDSTSGALIFVYAVAARGKQIVVHETGYLMLIDHAVVQSRNLDHEIPAFMRERQFFPENRLHNTERTPFVPLCALGIDADLVIMKVMVWMRSLRYPTNRFPMLVNCWKSTPDQPVENRYASVTIPVAWLDNGVPSCRVIQLPTMAYAMMQRGLEKGETTFSIRNAATSSLVKLDTHKPSGKLTADAIRPKLTRFWSQFEDYAAQITQQNAGMAQNVGELLLHVLINSHKSLRELNNQVFR